MFRRENCLNCKTEVIFYSLNLASTKDIFICLIIIVIIVGGVKKSSYFWSVKSGD
jgi:hypothetical protein